MGVSASLASIKAKGGTVFDQDAEEIFILYDKNTSGFLEKDDGDR